MNIEETIACLKSGGIILYPTDTIWGIGCDATNEEACKRIHELKNRPTEKSFIVLVDGFPMLERYVPDFHSVCYDLADLADKPLTIIYPSAKGLAPSVLASDGTVGIRITKDPICLKLIRSLKKPIVSTSANISGQSSPVSFNDIDEQIKNGVDAILEERLSEQMIKPSQIIKIGLNGAVKVIRK
ncbi:MAG: L-threonylcarbamoyladenylate synthase [Bacteroidota bacterium]